jgi:hypothetical protein
MTYEDVPPILLHVPGVFYVNFLVMDFGALNLNMTLEDVTPYPPLLPIVKLKI